MAKKRKVIPVKTRPQKRTLGFGAYIETNKKSKELNQKVTHTVWESDREFIHLDQSPFWHDDTETIPKISPKAVGEIPPWEDDNTYKHEL
ncbi:MAG: hypothetical protein AAF208_09705 [Cyanobacteria bacterium P01_A01_bin.45]|mgnify:CR=1 FL=1